MGKMKAVDTDHCAEARFRPASHLVCPAMSVTSALLFDKLLEMRKQLMEYTGSRPRPTCSAGRVDALAPLAATVTPSEDQLLRGGSTQVFAYLWSEEIIKLRELGQVMSKSIELAAQNNIHEPRRSTPGTNTGTPNMQISNFSNRCRLGVLPFLLHYSSRQIRYYNQYQTAVPPFLHTCHARRKDALHGGGDAMRYCSCR